MRMSEEIKPLFLAETPKSIITVGGELQFPLSTAIKELILFIGSSESAA